MKKLLIDQREKINNMYFELSEAFENSRKGTKFIRMLDKALKHGFPINYMPSTGLYNPLLHRSIAWRKDVITRALLEAGANVNVRDKDGRTALMLAASYTNDISLLLEIADKTVDINALPAEDNEDSIKYTALSRLCVKYVQTGDRGLLYCVKHLLELGADPRIGKNFSNDAYIHYNIHNSIIAKRSSYLQNYIIQYVEQKRQLKELQSVYYEYEL